MSTRSLVLSQRRYAEAAEGARDAATGEIAAAAAGIELFARAAGGDAAGLEAALGRGCEACVRTTSWRSTMPGGPCSAAARRRRPAAAGILAHCARRLEAFGASRLRQIRGAP